MGSNHRPVPYEGNALPAELHQHIFEDCNRNDTKKRETGFEPATFSLGRRHSSQLNYSRVFQILYLEDLKFNV